MISESELGVMMMERELSVVPNAVVDGGGSPRFGTFRGELPGVDLGQLGGEFIPKWWQWPARRKRWNYGVVVTDEVLICQGIVDGGYFGQSFIYAVDLFEEKEIVSKKFTGAPRIQAEVNDRPARGHVSSFRSPGVQMSTTREPQGGPYQWKSSLHPAVLRQPDGLHLDCELQTSGGAPALTVISPVDDGGIVNVTQKWAGLPVSGDLRVGSRSYRLEDGLGAMDYTQGILARRTSWRWALAMGRLFDGRTVGLNLVAGFNDSVDKCNENALWIGDRLISLGRAEFEFSRSDPERPWMIRTEDGAVELFFDAYYVYRDVRDWKVVDSFFVQPAGRFEGRIRVDGKYEDVTLFGVTEDQEIRW